MNDFETVRMWLAPTRNEAASAAAFAALDRIEAELIRYERAANDLYLQNKSLEGEAETYIAEVERLRAVETECELLHDVVNGQEAEVERLRAALDKIATDDHGEHPWSWQECFEDIQKTARAALAKEEA